ncbi:MAG: hypothetical protein ACXVB4_16990 [Pseudobdellovibrionaceae bacterium]
MKRILLIVPLVALTASCTTLDQSFRLGAATGALTGAAATYAGFGASGRSPTLEEVGLGASLGLGLGLLTSYFIHQEVVEDRDELARQTEIFFGDLPPSPFIIPQPRLKKGGH